MSERLIKHQQKNPFTGEPVGSPTLEFTVPVDQSLIPDSATPPNRFIAIASGELTLEQYFNDLAHEPIRQAISPLLSHICTYQPQSLITIEGEWFVRCCSSSADDYSTANNFYIRQPLTDERMEQVLTELNIGDADLLQFIRVFHGLRDAMPGVSGYFHYTDYPIFDEAHEYEIEGGEEESWYGSRHIYRATNGNVLLVDPTSGRTAWVKDGDSIDQYSETFSEFLAKYIDFKSEYHAVFDGYNSVLLHLLKLRRH